jgi:hypothetical protein
MTKTGVGTPGLELCELCKLCGGFEWTVNGHAGGEWPVASAAAPICEESGIFRMPPFRGFGFSLGRGWINISRPALVRPPLGARVVGTDESRRG